MTAKQPDRAALTAALTAALGKLKHGEGLTREEARAVMRTVLLGEASADQIGALLTGLRDKGETAGEITGFAEAMRAAARPVFDDANPRPPGTLVDTCGTGGDNAGLFNVSTAAALVVAATGQGRDVRVAKHGNRSLSSRCGSADVLEALGVPVEQEPAKVAASIRAHGFGFLFAPFFHESTRHAQPVRRKLGGRTVFNLLGPLTNPAAVDAQVVGVYDPKWLVPMAEALGQLGARRAFVVHSRDGLDEVSLSAPTDLAELNGGKVTTSTIAPEDFALAPAPREALLGGDAPKNAEMIRKGLSGSGGPTTDIVLLNASLAMVAAGLAGSLPEGIDGARTAVQSGAALDCLNTLKGQA